MFNIFLHRLRDLAIIKCLLIPGTWLLRPPNDWSEKVFMARWSYRQVESDRNNQPSSYRLT